MLLPVLNVEEPIEVEPLTVLVSLDSLIRVSLIVLNVSINVKNVLEVLQVVQHAEEIELEQTVNVLVDILMMDIAKIVNLVCITVLYVLDQQFKIVLPV